jgi:hypothetical protein
MFVQNDFGHRKLRAISAGSDPHGPIGKTGKRGLNHGCVNPE